MREKEHLIFHYWAPLDSFVQPEPVTAWKFRCRQQLERIITKGCVAQGKELPRMYKKIARKKYLNLAKKKRWEHQRYPKSNPSATAIREKRSGLYQFPDDSKPDHG